LTEIISITYFDNWNNLGKINRTFQHVLKMCNCE